MTEIVNKDVFTMVITEYGMFMGIRKDEDGYLTLEDAVSFQGNSGLIVGKIQILEPKIIGILEAKSPFLQAYYQIMSGITLK